MRRDQRIKEKDDFKKVLYVSGIILTVALIAFIAIFVSYYNSLKDNSSNFDTLSIAKNAENKTKNEILEEASMAIGKTVDESQNTLNENIIETNVENDIVENTIESSTNSTNSTNTQNEKTNTTGENENKVQEVIAKEEVVHDPEFIMPVSGEIIKEYAKENLVYSDTLKEWVTHNGIDIESEKASVVKAAEEGTVTSIKNDPRYGITITIDHVNGFQTRYSNLLTTEFVTVGEKVTKEQTIGTVGNTAAFEIADNSHLHFEILKDNENLDPTLYIK